MYGKKNSIIKKYNNRTLVNNYTISFNNYFIKK